MELIEYLLERVKPHPVVLMPFIKEWAGHVGTGKANAAKHGEKLRPDLTNTAPLATTREGGRIIHGE